VFHTISLGREIASEGFEPEPLKKAATAGF